MVTLPDEIDEGLYALLRQVGEGGAHVAEQRPLQQLLSLLRQPQVRVGRLRELKFRKYLQCVFDSFTLNQGSFCRQIYH